MATELICGRCKGAFLRKDLMLGRAQAAGAGYVCPSCLEGQNDLEARRRLTTVTRRPATGMELFFRIYGFGLMGISAFYLAMGCFWLLVVVSIIEQPISVPMPFARTPAVDTSLPLFFKLIPLGIIVACCTLVGSLGYYLTRPGNLAVRVSNEVLRGIGATMREGPRGR